MKSNKIIREIILCFIFILFRLQSSNCQIISNNNFNLKSTSISCGIFNFDLEISNSSCLCSGSVKVDSISGGQAPYSLNLIGSSAIENNGYFYPVCDGTYDLAITDSLGSTCTTSINVLLDTLFLVFDTIINPNCGANGVICFHGTGGIPPYEYSIDGGSFWFSSTCLTNLPPSTQIILIKDSVACIKFESATLLGPTPLSYLDSIVTPSCLTCCDGDLNIFPSGGIPPYIITFDTIISTGNYCSGYHSFCITDSLNCILCDSVFIDNFNSINFNEYSTNSKVQTRIWPNPTNNKFQIENFSNPTHHSKIDVTLIDIAGKKMMLTEFQSKNSTIEVDISQIPSGIYIGEVIFDTFIRKNFKIIKE